MYSEHNRLCAMMLWECFLSPGLHGCSDILEPKMSGFLTEASRNGKQKEEKLFKEIKIKIFHLALKILRETTLMRSQIHHFASLT